MHGASIHLEEENLGTSRIRLGSGCGSGSLFTPLCTAVRFETISLVATTLQWAAQFGGRYMVWVDGVQAHEANLSFAPHSGGGFGSAETCLAVTLTPIGAGGSAKGFFHLKSSQCFDHPGDNQRPGPLTGGWMECVYIGTHGDSGYIRANLGEVPPSNDQQIYLAFNGWVFEQSPRVHTYDLRIICEGPKRPLRGYPWLLK